MIILHVKTVFVYCNSDVAWYLGYCSNTNDGVVLFCRYVTQIMMDYWVMWNWTISSSTVLMFSCNQKFWMKWKWLCIKMFPMEWLMMPSHWEVLHIDVTIFLKWDLRFSWQLGVEIMVIWSVAVWDWYQCYTVMIEGRCHFLSCPSHFTQCVIPINCGYDTIRWLQNVPTCLPNCVVSHPRTP